MCDHIADLHSPAFISAPVSFLVRGEDLVVLAVRWVLMAFTTAVAPSVAVEMLLPPHTPTTGIHTPSSQRCRAALHAHHTAPAPAQQPQTSHRAFFLNPCQISASVRCTPGFYITPRVRRRFRWLTSQVGKPANSSLARFQFRGPGIHAQMV